MAGVSARARSPWPPVTSGTSELTHNDFTTCPGAKNTLSNSYLTTAQEDCLAVTSDFAYQYGNDYGGATTMNEVYIEFNLPAAQERSRSRSPWSSTLRAVKRSTPTRQYMAWMSCRGPRARASLPTWKASLVWEPIEGIRFRGRTVARFARPGSARSVLLADLRPGQPCLQGLL